MTRSQIILAAQAAILRAMTRVERENPGTIPHWGWTAAMDSVHVKKEADQK